MSRITKKINMIATLLIPLAFALYGCSGGGGGGSAQAPAQQAPANSVIKGVVRITGTDACSGVVVVAEGVADGVTRTVARMLDGAKSGTRVEARIAADTAGVYMATTGDACSFSFTVPEGDYSVYAYKEDTVGAQPQRVTARSAAAVTVNFELVATGKVSGTAVIGSSASDMIIVYLDGTSFAAIADGSGAYTISNVPVGTYSIVFARAGVKYVTKTGVVVTAGQTTTSALTSTTVACIGASDCSDGLATTADVCTGAGTESSVCSNPPSACSMDADCNDSNASTVDTCVNPGQVDAYCSNALTVASGYITQNTTWTLQNSPVTILGAVRVAEGITLTIEPGVVLKFKYPGTCSYILGLPDPLCSLGGIAVGYGATLIAEGTANAPIEMTLTDISAEIYGAGYWSGIYLGEGSVGSLSYINMRYPAFPIQVEYAGDVAISNITVTDASVPIGGNVFGMNRKLERSASSKSPSREATSGYYSSVYGAAVHAYYPNVLSVSGLSIDFIPNIMSFVELAGFLIDGQNGPAISLSNISITNSPYVGFELGSVNNVAVNGVNVTNPAYFGIHVYYSTGVTCENCYVSGAIDNGLQINDSSDIAFTNCAFNGSNSNGAYLSYNSGGNISLVNCDFSFNAYSGIYSNWSPFTVTNSRAEGNCDEGIYYYDYGYGGAASISSSNIINNGSYGVYNDGGILDISGLFFEGNNGVGPGVIDSTTGTSTDQKYNITSVTSPASSRVSGTPNTPGTMPNCEYYYSP